MKTIFFAISLIGLTAFAAPAAADCATIAQTGTTACVFADEVSSRSVTADQQDVGGASYSSYSYEFFGMRYSGTSAYVYVLGNPLTGPASASYSTFCMGAEDGCDYQDDAASVSSKEAGYAYVTLSQWSEGRNACYGAADRHGCEMLP